MYVVTCEPAERVTLGPDMHVVGPFQSYADAQAYAQRVRGTVRPIKPIPSLAWRK